MINEEITGAIINASFEVSNELGAGFLESVYEKALIVALAQRGLNISAQVPLKVRFRNVIVGEFFADLIVEEKVLVELKAVSRLLPEHKAQVINYLNATGIETGLLLNFGNPRVEYYRLHKRKDPDHPVNPV
ncbi:MAG TPA: GxxExxY protein [Pyrinomonadaceae bacterium]|nr:GxxExxY protein [Pyrinomonadaceae bacterium]